MGSQLRVLSANLKNGQADPQAFVELVQAWQADVVVVQELAPTQADALARVLPHGRLEPSSDYLGMGILLRRPAALDRVALVHRDARTARLDPSVWPELDRVLEIVNVHIQSPISRILPVRLLRRHRQIRGLCEYLDTSAGPRVVLGDFNATPAWPVYWQVAQRLEDLARVQAHTRATRPARTWSPRIGGVPLLRIDHCFGQGVAVDEFEVVEIRGSDHRGLVVDLSLETDPDQI
jgi:endonuclease/exonuclease/phosphatase (EEP) superfamily protein YafD